MTPYGRTRMTWKELVAFVQANMTPAEQDRPVRFLEPYDKDRAGHDVEPVRATEKLYTGDVSSDGEAAEEGREVFVPEGHWVLR